MTGGIIFKIIKIKNKLVLKRAEKVTEIIKKLSDIINKKLGNGLITQFKIKSDKLLILDFFCFSSL